MSFSKRSFLSLFIVLASFNALAEIDVKGAMEGVHYQLVKPAQPTSAPEGKVEVTEFFWYGCPHCFKFEPYINEWLKNKSDNIVFKRIPAVFSPKWESHARAYYAAEAMGITEKIHQPLFLALHVDRKPLFKEADIIDFVASLGIDKKKFSDTYRSFAISAKVQQSKKLGTAYNLSGVPSIVVNGKYVTSATHTGSMEGLIVLMNALAEAELGSTGKANATPAVDVSK